MAVSRRVELIGAVCAVSRVRVRAVAAMMDGRKQQLMCYTGCSDATGEDKMVVKEGRDIGVWIDNIFFSSGASK